MLCHEYIKVLNNSIENHHPCERVFILMLNGVAIFLPRSMALDSKFVCGQWKSGSRILQTRPR